MSKLFQFPEICITQASAGSGKTYALAKRYVQLLLLTARDNPQSYKNILAITFTNKASVEMKTRVLSFLKKMAMQKLSAAEEKQFLEPLSMSAQEAGELAFGLMESLIRHYHFFAVKTIDSFINALLVGCAFKINLSARFKIQRNSADYLQRSLDEWILLSHQDKQVKAMLEEFIHQYLFLENRSGWFPKDDLLEVLKTLFSEFNIHQKVYLSFPVGGRDLYLVKREFLEVVGQIVALSEPSMNKRLIEGLEKFVQEHPVSFDLDELSSYFARPEFPANKGVEVSPELNKLWAKAHKAASDLCMAESYGVFNAYVGIFEKVYQVFARLSSQDDVLFLEELNKKASLLIEDGISVTELYYRLAVRFNHYLIDEFQDTSLSQWQNLSGMVQEALSTGGSLFLVGDKKQAIYSFRGGESRLFDEIIPHLANAELRREYLQKNYRSHRAIVEFNNGLFSSYNLRDFLARRQDYYLSKKNSDEVVFSANQMAELEAVFEHSIQEIKDDLPNGYVKVTRIEGRRKQERQQIMKEQLLQTINDVRTRFRLKDIVILTRSNAQVQEITQWLLNEGIMAQSDRTSDIKNHPLVLELVDFLKFLDNPSDNVSFARFLLGDLFPKASGISKEELQEFLFTHRLKSRTQGSVYLYQAFREQYPQVWKDLMEDFFGQAGIYPVYELMVSIYARFKVHAFEEVQGFLMHFLELIKRQEEFSCDTQGFIQYFDNLKSEERFVPAAAANALKIMTVHKAKGLEFPVVIIPSLEMTVQTSKGTQAIMSYCLDVEDRGLQMLRLKKTYGRFNERLQQRYEDEYVKSFMVELNNVYVALTRAVSELHVMVPERAGNSINPAWFLIPEDAATHGVPLKFHQEEPKTATALLKANFDRQWTSQLKEEFESEPQVQLKQRQDGTILHYALSQIPRLEGDQTKQVAQALDATRMYFGLQVEERHKDVLMQFLNREDVRRFFELPTDAQVLCEQEIVDSHGDTKRLDRLIVMKNKVLIVDFKSGHSSNPQHERQIKEYERLISQLYPRHNVEGFLVYFRD